MLNIQPDSTVREILTTHPNTFDVFLRHGMCADCQNDPPPVPLHHFARKHCGGRIDALIEELMSVIGHD